MADPAWVSPECQDRGTPADAGALVETIQSDLGDAVSAALPVTAGDAHGQALDLKISAGSTICAPATDAGDPLRNAPLQALFSDAVGSTFTFADGKSIEGPASGEWMRLYLFDMPKGSSNRILAIAIVAPEARFDHTVSSAQAILDSIQFHVAGQ